MIGEHLKNGHLVKEQMWLKDQIIFILKANFSKGLKISGPLGRELLLSKELTTSSLKETLIREHLKSGHQVRGLQLLKDLTIYILKANFNKGPKSNGLLGKELQL